MKNPFTNGIGLERKMNQISSIAIVVDETMQQLPTKISDKLNETVLSCMNCFIIFMISQSTYRAFFCGNKRHLETKHLEKTTEKKGTNKAN